MKVYKVIKFVKLKKVLIAILKFYKRYLSRGYYCRFVPSCSEYTMEAVEKYGVIKGGWMGIKRVARCNRWSKRPQLDPVGPRPS